MPPHSERIYLFVAMMRQPMHYRLPPLRRRASPPPALPTRLPLLLAALVASSATAPLSGGLVILCVPRSFTMTWMPPGETGLAASSPWLCCRCDLLPPRLPPAPLEELPTTTAFCRTICAAASMSSCLRMLSNVT